jgi:CubicO group peptidase (beta-lactamase class C family)
MTDPIDIHGNCDDRFAAVKEAFAKNFEQGLEVGASFSAVVGGECVVDLWAGHSDAAQTRRWERDTIVNVFSTTKMMAALSTLLLVDRGGLDLDAPVASVWPEFAQQGKGKIPVRQLLSHTSGLPGWDTPITVDTLYDWDHTVSLLAAQKPWWEPGEQSGYHAITHGFLVGEVVRRACGKTIGRFFREQIAEPLGADFHIGTAAQHDARVGELIPPGAQAGAGNTDPNSVAARAIGNPALTGDMGNRLEWRRAEIPAANGHGNARSVARIGGAVANGNSPLLSEATLAKAIEEQHYGTDLVLGLPIRWGLGFGLTSKDLPIGPNPRTFFWGGWGGSLVVIDPDAQLGVAYVMNKMSQNTLGDTRAFGPLAALYASL